VTYAELTAHPNVVRFRTVLLSTLL